MIPPGRSNGFHGRRVLPKPTQTSLHTRVTGDLPVLRAKPLTCLSITLDFNRLECSEDREIEGLAPHGEWVL